MNHRELLKKYLRHVVSEESVSYVEFWFPRACDSECQERMTAEDWAELRAIDAEVRAEREAARAKWDAEWRAAHPLISPCVCIRRPQPVNGKCVICARPITQETL